MTSSTEAPSAPSPPSAVTDPLGHLNSVQLIGELATGAEVRALPNGDEVVGCRIVVRTGSVGYGGGHKAAPPVRTDSIDCVTSVVALRKRLLSYGPGDVIEVSGALRHRYWRGPGGLNSRYEVELTSVRRRRRADG
jgi:single-strand DNA-binding protein